MSEANNVLLEHSDYRVEVDPGYGGRITAFWSESGGRQVDWLVPTPAEGRDVMAPLSSGSYPLTPFSNRIRDGRFSFAGKDYQIEATEKGKPHALHGHGCREVWQVDERTVGSVRLSYDKPAGEWPFPYRAEQAISLSDDGLKIDISVENRGQTDMPVGLGHHPYFPRDENTRLTSTFRKIWPAVSDSIPDGPEVIPEPYDFSAGRVVPTGLDTGFSEWGREALIEWPDQGRSLRIIADDALSHAIIYSPSGKDFFCFEPVSHAINAINLVSQDVAGTGFVTIGPGGKFGGRIEFSPSIA